MENVPKIVLKRLQSTAESHPDADLLTAFAEHSLAGAERDDLMKHLSRCEDCREVVALALPASEIAEVTYARKTVGSPWFSWPLLRWGVVTAGFLAITSFGILQYHNRENKTLVASSMHEPMQPTGNAEPAPPIPPAASAPTQTDRSSDKLAAAKPAARQQMPSSSPRARPAERSDTTANVVFPSVEGRHPSAVVGGRVNIGSNGLNSADAASLGSPNDKPEQVGKAKDALEPGVALAPAPFLRSNPALLKNSAAPRWTIGPTGALQRSFDGGQTWQVVSITAANMAGTASARTTLSAMQSGAVKKESSTQTTVEVIGRAPLADAEAKSGNDSSVQAQTKTSAKLKSDYQNASATNSAAATVFRAVSVSADSSEVWAGGSGSALYHTVDGGNFWSRVNPSDASVALTGDIVSIQFSDAANGVVITSTSERWITSDAGQTWHKQQ